MIKSKSYSRSKRSCTMSMCNSPRKPQRNPNLGGRGGGREGGREGGRDGREGRERGRRREGKRNVVSYVIITCHYHYHYALSIVNHSSINHHESRITCQSQESRVKVKNHVSKSRITCKKSKVESQKSGDKSRTYIVIRHIGYRGYRISNHEGYDRVGYGRIGYSLPHGGGSLGHVGESSVIEFQFADRVAKSFVVVAVGGVETSEYLRGRERGVSGCEHNNNQLSEG